MPSLNFMDLFAEPVAAGAKRCTVRRAGKRKPGDTLYLYNGLRRDAPARLLGTHLCLGVTPILIVEAGGEGSPVSRLEPGYGLELSPGWVVGVKLSTKWLTVEQVEELARKDTAGLWDAHKWLNFFHQTYALPFAGDLIYW